MSEQTTEMTIQRGQEVGDNGLTTTREQSAELATASDSAAAQAEIQSALVLANRFPRDEDSAFQKLIRACKRTTFAQGASYSFPRGGQKVTGPSVNLAREAARVWGNIRYGLEVVRDDSGNRKIRGWAWDLETNTKIAAEDEFQKLIQRKGKNGGATQWLVPDERDLRELTNRRGAILIRNCILQLLPYDLIEDAANTARGTMESESARDPDAERKRLIAAFDNLNISSKQIAAYLKHPIGEASPAQLTELRQIWKSISDGNSTWAEYAPREAPGKEVTVGDLKKDEKKAEPEPEPKAEPEAKEEESSEVPGVEVIAVDDPDAPGDETAVDAPDEPEKPPAPKKAISQAAVQRIKTAVESKGCGMDALEAKLGCYVQDLDSSDEIDALKIVDRLPKLKKGEG